MSSLIRDMDLCGSIVGIVYDGHHRYKSIVGGGITILSGLGILAVAIYYLNIFFSQSTTKMSIENMKYSQPPIQDISKDFIMAVQMQFNGTIQFRPDLVKVDAYYYQKTPGGTIRSPLNPIPCNQSDFHDDARYQALELDKAICLDLKDLILQGSNVNDLFNYVQIRFLLCIDNSKSCYPKSLIGDYFQLTKPLALVYFLDSTFQLNNKLERYMTFFNYVDVNVTFNNAKATNIYFSKNEMRVDDSYFFSSAPKVYSRYMIDSFRDLVSVRTDLQDEALLINLMASKNQQIVNVSFMQLSELLANIGALINIIILLLTSVGNFINHYYFQNDLMNALYVFEPKNNKQRRQYVNIKSLNNYNNMPLEKDKNCSFNNNNVYGEVQKKEKGNNVHNSNILRIINLCTDNLNNKNKNMSGNLNVNFSLNNSINVNNNNNSNMQFTYTDNDNKEMNKNNKKKSKFGMKFNYEKKRPIVKKEVKKQYSNYSNKSLNRAFNSMDIVHIIISEVMPFLKCKELRKRANKYHCIEDSMSSFQDFINLFKKLQEIDLIKYLLFTENQINLYNIIPKPEWNTKESQIFSTLYHQKQFHFLKSYNEIDEYLHNKDLRNKIANSLAAPKKNEIEEKLNELIKSRLGNFTDSNQSLSILN